MRARLAMWALVTGGCGFSIHPGVADEHDASPRGDAADRDADIDGATVIVDGPLPSNLIAWYPMDGLTNMEAADATGHGHIAQCGGGMGCPTVVAGKIGNGYMFDGADDRMQVASTTTLNMTTGFTVAFWAKFTRFPDTYGCPVGKYYGTMQSNSYQLCRHNSEWSFGAQSQTAAGFILTATPGPEIGAWYHGAITWDDVSDTKRIFVNGTELDTQIGVTQVQFDAGPITLGADLSNGSQADRFEGILDDVRIYNTALSAQEIAALAALASP